MGVYRGWEGAFKQHSDIKKNLLCGDGAGLRKCILEFRPYKEDELAVVQPQHKCGVAGMRRIWEKREQQRDGTCGPVMRLDSFRKDKKHLKWEKRVFKTHPQSLFGFLKGSTSVS